MIVNLTSNAISKTGRTILTASFPVGETCRKNAPCYKKCYGRKGTMRYPAYLKSMEENLKVYKTNPEFYYQHIHMELQLIPYRYFRWFVTGDMPDEAFFEKVAVRLAFRHPQTKFLMFTKKFEYVNAFLESGHTIPSNLNVVFSAWGNFMPENPYNLPVSYVRFSEKDKETNEYIPSDARECSGKCYNCMDCWHLKHGESVVFNRH